MPDPLTDAGRAAATRVHYTDRRVRQLASAAWQLATGGTHTDWLVLGKDHPENLITEARDWVRAAVAAGLLPPPAELEAPPAEPHRARTARNTQDRT